MNTDKLLDTRRETYGDFGRLADISQELKDIITKYSSGISNVHRESLDMICLKMARILNGDPTFPDNWEDIAGYAKLPLRPESQWEAEVFKHSLPDEYRNNFDVVNDHQNETFVECTDCLSYLCHAVGTCIRKG